jgi:hypothetical protein
MEGIVE